MWIAALTAACVVGIVTGPVFADGPSRSDRRKQFMEKFDKNKDGKIDDKEREAIRKAFAERRGSRAQPERKRPEPKRPARGDWAKRAAEARKQFMEKYDKNKDGKICDKEREAVKKAFGERHAEFRKEMGERHAEMRKQFMEKFDKNKDGKICEKEREAVKKAFSERAAEWHKKMAAHHGHRHAKPKAAKPSCPKAKPCPKAKSCPKAKQCPKAKGQVSPSDKRPAPGKCPKKGTCRPKKGPPSKAGRPHPHHRHHPGHGHHRHDGDRHKGDRDRGHARPQERPGPDMAGAIIARNDKNKDGKLNVDEYPERYRKYFGQNDANDDGYVDKAELARALAKVRGKK